ncbi:MAG: hypothetical protein GYB67_14065 [Chloroflexi bacterium]|nr:hypothetical protein [Chloroflexota bacterium]
MQSRQVLFPLAARLALMMWAVTLVGLLSGVLSARVWPQRDLLAYFVYMPASGPVLNVMDMSHGLTWLMARGVNDLQPMRWSPDGTLIAYVVFGDPGGMHIHVVDVFTGENRALTTGTSANFAPEWSPDGSHIAFVSNRDGVNEIYVMAADGSDQRNVTNQPAHFDDQGVWSPDGTHLIFQSHRGGRANFYQMTADGELVGPLAAISFDTVPYWSPDGNVMLLSAAGRLYHLDAAGGQPQPISADIGAHARGWSPDGSQIVYIAAPDDSTRELYRARADGSDPRRLTVNQLAEIHASWSADGRYIAYDGQAGRTYASYVIDAHDGTVIMRLRFRAKTPVWQPPLPTALTAR